jgi:hypothetical protein
MPQIIVHTYTSQLLRAAYPGQRSGPLKIGGKKLNKSIAWKARVAANSYLNSSFHPYNLLSVCSTVLA